MLPLIRFHWFPFRVGVMQGGRGDLGRRKIRLPNRPGGLLRLPAAKPLEASFTIRRLRRSELPADTVALARFLIGKIVVRELAGARLSGRIVETEAYPQRDPAAHHLREFNSWSITARRPACSTSPAARDASPPLSASTARSTAPISVLLARSG